MPDNFARPLCRVCIAFMSLCFRMCRLLGRSFSRLGLLDRASALGLTKAFLDFDGSEESWRRYDKITAREARRFTPPGIHTLP